eukprot:TRINITY_DN933_c0_g1_i1.p1 TRINITY_DN933_c0_g1~~TRINITY_DN933_c0_g1_i1.p1  ORF type:complete len:279 (-),score=47.16 TRINITY_DN933_c0_g1_i1:157-993(-)
MADALTQLQLLWQTAGVYLRENVPTEYVTLYDEALSHQHPLSKTLPLMNPFEPLALCIAYLAIVYGGRVLMRPFPAFKLRYLSILHNVLLVILSAYMSIEVLRQAYLNNFSLWCNSVGPDHHGMAKVLWLFYFSKIPEFGDTFLMVLKKSDRQISFLHVYHHSTILLIWWAVIFYGPGGDAYFSAFLNSFVHVVMYTYYLISAMGREVWFKKYITSFQMLQFSLNFAQGVYDIYFRCDYPLFLYWILVIYMVTLLILFGNFYRQTYSKGKGAAKGKSE